MPHWLLSLDRHFPIRYLAWLACAVVSLLGAFTWVAFGVGGGFALLGALGVITGLHDVRQPGLRQHAAFVLFIHVDIPGGIGAVGYDEGDIPDLVEGTMKQQRLLATAPRDVTEDDVAGIYRRSLSLW